VEVQVSPGRIDDLYILPDMRAIDLAHRQ
jgi:hypothetical protein